MVYSTAYKINLTEKILYIVIVLLLFHITRNISTIVYVGLLFFAYTLLYIVYFGTKWKNGNVFKIEYKPIELFFVFSLMMIPVISLLNMEINEFIISFGRYMVTFPFIFFIVTYKEFSIDFIRKTFKTIVIFMTLAALSIPYQIVFGPITFFADASIRGGVIRYTSLAGSLTALGTLGALALAILLFTEDYLFTKKSRYFLIILLLFGMLLSLQKAAIANIFICFTLYILLNKNVNIIKRILTVLLLIVMFIIIYYLSSGTQFSNYIESLIKFTFSDSYYGIEQDFLSRLWERPYEVIIFNDMSIFDLIIGIGFKSLGGIMGLINVPQAHNNFFDLLFTGGILHLVTFILLLLSIPSKVVWKKINGLKINIFDRTYTIIIILIIANMVIGAASFYQPIMSVILFVTLFSYDIVSKKYVCIQK